MSALHYFVFYSLYAIWTICKKSHQDNRSIVELVKVVYKIARINTTFYSSDLYNRPCRLHYPLHRLVSCRLAVGLPALLAWNFRGILRKEVPFKERKKPPAGPPQ